MPAEIVRQTAFKNLSQDQEIDFRQQNFNRTMTHRCLKNAGIEHDINWGFDALINLMHQHNVPFEFLPPGNKEPKIKTEAVSNAATPELAELIKQAELLNKQIASLVAGKVEPEQSIVVDNSPQVKLSRDGWPSSVFVLRKWCRERDIPCNNKDKRTPLIEKLKANGKNPT